MKETTDDIWWMMLLRGLALLSLGVVAVIWPGLSFALLAIFFAAYLFVSGVADIITSIGSMKTKRAWFLITLLGILEVGVGIFLLRNPAITAATYLFVIGATILAQGILMIIAAFANTDDGGMRFLAIFGGVLALIAGFYVLRYPVTGGLAFVWMLGVYGIVGGAFEIAASLSMKSSVHEIETRPVSRSTSVRTGR